jgi:hypothetical protein
MPDDARRLDLNDFISKYEVALLPQHMDIGKVELNRVIHEFRNPNDLDPSEWEDWEDAEMGEPNSQQKIDKMVEDLNNGLGLSMPPVIVEGLSDDPRWRQQVVDGHHRTRAHQLAQKLIGVVYTLETLIEYWHKRRNQPVTRKEVLDLRNGYLKNMVESHEL